MFAARTYCIITIIGATVHTLQKSTDVDLEHGCFIKHVPSFSPSTIEWNQHKLKRHALYSVGLLQLLILFWSKFAHARVKLDLMSAGASFATCTSRVQTNGTVRSSGGARSYSWKHAAQSGAKKQSLLRLQAALSVCDKRPKVIFEHTMRSRPISRVTRRHRIFSP